ncbi:uncharacterized protein METZ01_LOCUS203724 [marine metagenome]|uniref:Uncharacterized protein n=1 Tax=marine metagenome TaxID=408172 RepID=A0A382EJJ9_9ZZZZ
MFWKRRYVTHCNSDLPLGLEIALSSSPDLAACALSKRLHRPYFRPTSRTGQSFDHAGMSPWAARATVIVYRVLGSETRIVAETHRQVGYCVIEWNRVIQRGVAVGGGVCCRLLPVCEFNKAAKNVADCPASVYSNPVVRPVHALYPVLGYRS